MGLAGMGQEIQFPGGCIPWLDSGSESWRQKPLGILLVLFDQSEERSSTAQLPSSQLMRKNFVLKIQSCWLLFYQTEHLRTSTVLFCSQVPSEPRPISLDGPVSMKSLLKLESSCRESGGWEEEEQQRDVIYQQ